MLLCLDVLAYGGVGGQTILAGDDLRVGGREVGRGSTHHRRLLLLGELRLGLCPLPALALARLRIREHAGSGQLVPGEL